MRLLSHSGYITSEFGQVEGSSGGSRGAVVKNSEVNSFSRSLGFGKNYLKGTAYGSGGANCLTLGTPTALFRLYDRGHVIDQHYGVTQAHLNT
jgi:hypothetical protein